LIQVNVAVLGSAKLPADKRRLAMQVPQTSFPRKVVHVLVGAWRGWRERRARIAELAACDPMELSHMAGDLNLSCEELISLARRDDRSADLVERRLRALGFDPAALSAREPAVMRDLQRCCSVCGNKTRCTHDLDAGVTRGNWRHYCVNSDTLAALMTQRRRSLSFAARIISGGKQ
jgi:hypothetical protein